MQKQQRISLQCLIDLLQLEYYRYEVTYGLYVLTPGEKWVANIIVIIFLALLIWALAFYFPPILYHKLGRLVWLFTGHSDEKVRPVLAMLD
ncbi:hypothetical protein N7454_001966 [Penicillium verhagenii]|nr:hypothetical protein N7454_001966 [Penicillium verhagenii]